MTNHWNDIDNTSLVFVFGANPAENHPACMAHVNAARFGTAHGTKKARLIVVDPRLTRTARQCDPNRTNLAGTAATFSAAASGVGPLSYQWLLNGISLRDNGHVLGAIAGTLNIANVQPADAGNLALAVSSPGGVAVASVATLVVEVPPPCQPAPPDLVGW